MIKNFYYKSKLGLDPEFAQWWSRLTSTPVTWKNSYLDAFNNLKSIGIWNKADAFYLLAGHNAVDSLQNSKSSSNTATQHNSPTYTSKEGFKGGGSAYINTHFNPETNGVNWQLNDAGIYVYVNDTCMLGNRYHAGAYSTEVNATFIASDAGSVEAVNGNFVYLGIPYDVVNIRGNSRSSSGIVRSFWNNNFYNLSSSSNTITPLDIYLLTLNEAGSAGYFYSCAELSCAYMGASLTDSEVLDLKTFMIWWFSEIAAL